MLLSSSVCVIIHTETSANFFRPSAIPPVVKQNYMFYCVFQSQYHLHDPETKLLLLLIMFFRHEPLIKMLEGNLSTYLALVMYQLLIILSLI